MTQEDCLKFLKARKYKWFTAKQIADGTNVGLNAVRVNLKKLWLWGRIDRKIEREYKYKYPSTEKSWNFINY